MRKDRKAGKERGKEKKIVKEIKNKRSFQQRKFLFSNSVVRTVLAICDWSAMKSQEQGYGQ
jgi:hypothetical protein